MSCATYNGEWWTAISQYAFRDAVLCPYYDTVGQVFFVTAVVLGVVNLPIYIRTDSVLIPFIITVAIGGLVLTQMAAMAQGLVVAAVLFILGVGPILVLRRVQTP